VLVVDHVATHRLTIDNDGVHDFVRPPHLAAGALIEQIAIA